MFNIKFLCVSFAVLIFRFVRGHQDIHRNVLKLPEIKSQNSSLHGLAWTDYDRIERAMSSLSVCLWVKSANLLQTGTLFSYISSDNIMQFGLISIERPWTKNSSLNTGSYDVYLVIMGQLTSESIPLRLDDAIWHCVCMTWDIGGTWKVFTDGIQGKQGENFQVNKWIPASKGKLFLGSGGTMRRELYSSGNSLRKLVGFTGKISGLNMWSVSLSPSDIAEISNCDLYNHYYYDKTPTESPLDDALAVSTRFSYSLIYDWSVDQIKTLWPASFYPSEDVCKSEITVECIQNSMLVSLSRKRFSSSPLPYSNLRLNDPNCHPTVRGRNGDRYVFDVESFSSCMTRRQVTDKEIIYSNRVTNSPSNRVVFGNFRFEAEVRCHFPIDLTISSRFIDSANQNKLFSKTPMINPKTNREDLEAIVYLFKDDAFTQLFVGSADLAPTDYAYVGLVVKDKFTQDAVNKVNVVVDTCWVTSRTQKRQIIANDGCWVASDGINVLENGRRSQARIKISSAVFSLSVGPLFLQCTVHTCLGDSCAPTCGSNQTASFTSITSNILSSSKMKLSKREVSPDRRDYDVTIGPVFVKDSGYNNQSDDNKHSNSAHSFITLPVLIIVISLLAFVIVCCLLLTVTILWKKKKHGNYKVNGNREPPEPVQIMKHRQRKTSEVSLPSISFSIASSTNSLSSIDSYEFISVSQQCYHHTI